MRLVPPQARAMPSIPTLLTRIQLPPSMSTVRAKRVRVARPTRPAIRSRDIATATIQLGMVPTDSSASKEVALSAYLDP
jgi:hypothetical protein